MTPFGFPENIKETAKTILDSQYIIAITGAGISTPSGIPDFRSTGTGLWEKNDPMKVASLSAYYRDPGTVFNWLRPLVLGSQRAKPNDAHIALAALEKRNYLQAIITQNIDNLHQKAGSENIIEMHGSLKTFHCPTCKLVISSAHSDIIKEYLLEGTIPICPDCNSVLKPDITLYEEQLPIHSWEKAHDLCLQADLVLVIGTSLEVTPVSYLPQLAFSNGAKIIINTYSQTYLDPDAAIILRGDIGEVWPAVVKEIDNYVKFSP